MKPSTASELVDPGIPGCHGGFASRHFSAGDTGAARLVVTGNPNVGKSVIFQLLTGRYTTVSNYPGTTVVVARGSASLDGTTFQVCDTPGLNSLHASSEDELVARDLLLAEGVRVVQVSDAKNLPRALTLTLELAEAGAPAVLNLNMMDEARERGVAVDVERLSALLGIPVVQTIATQRWGIEKLRRAIPQARPAQLRVRYPGIVEEALARIVPLLPAALPARTSVALLWLAGDQAMRDRLAQRLDLSVVERLRAAASEAQARSSRPLGLLISHARLREAKRLAAQVMTAASREPRTPVVRGERRPALQRLGDLAMHPVWGVPILAGALFLMYVLVGDLAAQRGVEFFEKVVFGRYVVPAAQWVVRGLLPWPWWQALFIGEYGLVTMAAPYAFAIILPIVGMFFLFFGLIEDVGYLPRLAVMANRFCKLLGLNGKAVLPLVLGLGCDTMATMTTRILDTKRDRIITTLLLALGIPCSAQLGVIMAMLAGQPPLALGIWLGVL
ncbi:MAG: ferrous iron transporter B, partial [Candidatus Omnitrophica bacterium]|nr:ferrous iron transporter B [Candidatus Omnitrophota bacterium]